MASDKPTNNPGNQPDVPQADGAPESRGNIFDLLAEEEAVSERDQHIATFKQDVANDVTAANKLRQVFDLIAERKDEPEAQAFLNEVFKGIDMVEYIKSVGLAVTMVDMWEQIGKDQEFDEFLQNLFRTCFANEQLRALMRKPEPAPAPSRVQKSFEPAPASTPDSGPLHVSPELRQPSRMSAPRPAPVPAAPDPISASQAEPVQPAPRPAAKAAPAPAPAATPLGGGEVLESFDNEERQALLDRQTTEFLGQEDVPDTPANNLKQLFKFVLQMKHTPEAQAFFDGLNVDHGNALINAIEQNGLASVIVDMWDTVRRSNNIGFDEYLKELYTKLYSGEHFQALVALVNKRTESLSPQEELAPDPSIEIGPIVYDEGVDEEVEVLGVDDPNLVGFRDVPSFDVPSIDSDDDEDAIPLDSAGSAEIIEAKDVGRISEVLGSVLESESPLNGTSKENPADEAARAASIPPVQPEPKFGRGGSYTIAMRNHEVEEDSREHIRVVVAGTKMNVGPHAVVHVDLVDEGSEITLGSNSRIHIEKTTNGCKGNPVVIKKAPDAVIQFGFGVKKGSVTDPEGNPIDCTPAAEPAAESKPAEATPAPTPVTDTVPSSEDFLRREAASAPKTEGGIQPPILRPRAPQPAAAPKTEGGIQPPILRPRAPKSVKSADAASRIQLSGEAKPVQPRFNLRPAEKQPAGSPGNPIKVKARPAAPAETPAPKGRDILPPADGISEENHTKPAPIKIRPAETRPASPAPARTKIAMKPVPTRPKSRALMMKALEDAQKGGKKK